MYRASLVLGRGVISCFANILLGERELVALLKLFSLCLGSEVFCASFSWYRGLSAVFANNNHSLFALAKEGIKYMTNENLFAVWSFNYILVKSSNRPRVFLPIFGEAIRTISISFAFPNRPAYQSSITENG